MNVILSSFGSVVAIASFFLTLWLHFRGINIKIVHVLNFSDMKKHFSFISESGTDPVVKCIISNKSSSPKQITLYGYIFHFGTFLRQDCNSEERLQNKDVCDIVKLKSISEIGSVSGNSESCFTLDVDCRKSLSDNNRYLKKCAKLGYLLKQDILLVICQYQGRRKLAFYNISTQEYFTKRKQLILNVRQIVNSIHNLFLQDYTFIPDIAFTEINTVKNGLKDISVSEKCILSDCNDMISGAFYGYFAQQDIMYPHGYSEFLGVMYEQHDCICGYHNFQINSRDIEYVPANKQFVYHRYIKDEDLSISDFRSEGHRRLLSGMTFVTTCPPSSLFSEYISQLLEFDLDFKLLATTNLLHGFESQLMIAGDSFEALFYVPFDFNTESHRVYRSKYGEPMIKVKNCCWFIPKKDTERMNKMIQTEFRPKIRDLLPGYIDDENAGCYAMDGNLCVRPDYQRAFVYDDKKRNLVVDTVQQNMPLGIMYWMKNTNTGKYELMDGQQRTLSLLQYCSGGFSINYQYFHNLSQTEKDKILDYELLVYICEGTDDERREWFQRINVAGATLTDQEILNSIYSGPWCQDAKKYFSNPTGPAHQIAEKYLSGSPIRQDYLETALKWLCNRDGIEIADYMAAHQHDATALELWSYFRSVIDWVQSTFPNYRKKLMKGIPWGILYNQYGKTSYDPAALETRIAELEIDEDVTNQRGIYEFVLGGSERCLNIRAFSERDKRRKYGEQGGKCIRCGKDVEYEKCHGDHITPWSKGGHTTYDNLQILCADCNRTKSNH